MGMETSCSERCILSQFLIMLYIILCHEEENSEWHAIKIRARLRKRKWSCGPVTCVPRYCLVYWGIGGGEIETIGRQVSVQPKRKLGLRAF